MSKFCPKCGKELNENEEFCRSCGNRTDDGTTVEQQFQTPFQSQYQTQPPYEKQKINIFALIGFVVACVSLLINLWGIVGIAALILSIIGVSQINQGQGSGKGFAIAGSIIGGISVIYGFIVLLIISDIILI